MLDNLKTIHERDVQDALGSVERQWKHLGFQCTLKLPEDFDPSEVDTIVFIGTGSSMIAASIGMLWLQGSTNSKPFEIVWDYELPAYANHNTLCIIADYSGADDELVEVLVRAKAKSMQTIAITGNGLLHDAATKTRTPILQIPDAGQERYSQWYVLKALAVIFDGCRLIEYSAGNAQTSKAAELEAEQIWFRDQLQLWRPEKSTSRNEAKLIALELLGKSVVVYSGPKLAPAARCWKASINENAKQIAWLSQYPMCTYSEVFGWTKQPVHKPYAVIDLRSDLEHERIKRDFVVTEKMLSGLRPSPIVVTAAGQTLLQQLLYLVALGSYTSIYLALLSGINPSSDDTVKKMRKKLA